MSPRRSNLPRKISSFVGRNTELAELSRLLTGNRLVAVTGPGGSGKTRLVLEPCPHGSVPGTFARPREGPRSPP